MQRGTGKSFHSKSLLQFRHYIFTSFSFLFMIIHIYYRKYNDTEECDYKKNDSTTER